MPIEIIQLPLASYPLVNRFYREHQRGAKAKGHHWVWVAQDGAQIVAALCLQPIAQGYWLTSLVVAPNYRGHGHASTLLKKAREQVQESQRPVWLFCAPELTSLYSGNGFAPTDLLPEPLADRLQRYQRHKRLVALVAD
ncbi:MAG: GNAT family N-acetyltransferase [Halopseudomonas sp.]|uniref:GNAT family N-acetyltransferase n=1 Tax=Halopseudomonas sp. TaxID=2901191 RepID=UPI003000FE75